MWKVAAGYKELLVPLNMATHDVRITYTLLQMNKKYIHLHSVIL